MGTLLSYSKNERDTYAKATNAAQAALASAQAEVAKQQANVTTHTKEAATTDAAIAKKRAELAVTTVPSEAKRLIDEITQLVIARRRVQGGLVADQSALDLAQSERTFQQARLKRVGAQLAEAEKALATTTAEHNRREAQKNAIASAPLETLVDEANDALRDPTWQTAKAKFGPTVVPAEQFAGAKARYVLARTQVLAAQTALDGAQERLAAASGDLDKKGAAFRRAERDVALFATTAKQDFDRAIALLQKIADPGYRALTDSQSADALEPTKLADRKDAQAKESAIVAALGPYAVALAEFDEARLAARAKNPVATDDEIENDPAVKTAQGKLTAAKGTLDAARNAFTDAHKTTLAGWQAIIPDEGWQKIFDFLEAEALLRDLAARKPDTLVSDLVDRESELADALGTNAAAVRTSAFLEDVVVQRKTLAEAAAASRIPKTLGAVRGDSN